METVGEIKRKTRKRQIVNGDANSQQQNQSQDHEVFVIKLRPEEFRLGSRNKHIDSFSVNQRGFLAGGSNSGQVYLWKINFHNIRQRKSDGHYQWVNSFQLHKKANHYCQFSPSGNILMTGSAEGIAALWNTNFTLDLPQNLEKK